MILACCYVVIFVVWDGFTEECAAMAKFSVGFLVREKLWMHLDRNLYGILDVFCLMFRNEL